MPAVKKVKRKSQHREAIKEFEMWLRKHPQATHQEKFQAFDLYVDSSELHEMLEHATS